MNLCLTTSSTFQIKKLYQIGLRGDDDGPGVLVVNGLFFGDSGNDCSISTNNGDGDDSGAARGVRFLLK